MSKPPKPTNPCPACGGKRVVRVHPTTLSLAQASHQCETCGAQLASHLKWSKAVTELLIGIFLVLLGFAAFKVSEQLPAATPLIRFFGLLALLGAVFGFSAQRVTAALEFRLWVPKP